MRKPRPTTRTYYDYHECEAYIAKKLGIRSLRDVDQQYENGQLHEDRETKDFWLYLINSRPIHNGCYIQIDKYDLNQASEQWKKDIIQSFIDEFGEDVDYWIEW